MRKKPLFLVLFLVVVLAIGWFGTRHAQAPSHKTASTKPAPAATVAAKPQSDTALAAIITTWAAQQNFKSSAVVKELTGSMRTTTYNPTASMVPGSTYKLYVAYAVLHNIEQGKYSLSTTLDDGNTIQADLNTMILNSDNDAARTLGFMVGWKNINALLKTIGINSTDLYNYVPPSTQPVGDKHTTASDLAAIVQKLYAGTLLNKANTAMLLNLMENQYYRQRVPAGIPSGITVADKPGWLTVAEGDGENVENDAAIVYGPKSTYILVITTNGDDTQPLANLSKLVYDHLES